MRVKTLLALALVTISAWGANTTLDPETYTTTPGGTIFVGTTGPGGGGQITGGYFVDSAAAGGGNGTQGTPWNDLNDIMAALGPTDTSVDVWLKAGSTFVNQTLTIDWPGTVGDRAIVGCYFESAGTAYQCTAAQTKPIIQGNYPDTCSNNALCDIGDPDDTPTSIFLGLVNVNADYVTVQSVSLQDSAGRGLVADGAVAGGQLDGLVFDGVEMDHIANHGLYVRQAQNVVYRNGSITRVPMCDAYAEAACADSGGFVDGGNVRPWSGAATFNDTASGQVLFENNVVNRIWGEGISLFGGSNGVIRDNVVGHVVRPAIYVNHWNGFVIENNVLYGDPGGLVNPSAVPGMGYSQDAIAFRQETNNGGAGNRNNTGVVRNNLAVGEATCITMDDATAAVVSSDIDIYGNTCLGMTTSNVFVFNTVVATDVNISDNIFYSPSLTAAGNCTENIANVSWSNNLWAITPSDADCVGANDVIGNPQTATAYTALDDQNYTDPPAAADFALLQTSPAIAAGVDLAVSGCITPGAFTTVFGNASSSLSEAQWELCLFADVGEVQRPSLPSLGGVEFNGVTGILIASAGDDNISETTTATTPVAIGASDDDLLVCGVALEDNFVDDLTPATVAVTYDNVAMTALGSATQGTNLVQYFYMLNAALPPTANTYNAVATVTNGELSSGQGGVTISCASFQTHQVAPTIYSATGASTASVSNTVAVDNEDYLMVVASSSQGNRTHTWGTGTWTELMDLSKTLNNDTAQGAAIISGADFNQ